VEAGGGEKEKDIDNSQVAFPRGSKEPGSLEKPSWGGGGVSDHEIRGKRPLARSLGRFFWALDDPWKGVNLEENKKSGGEKGLQDIWYHENTPPGAKD